MHTTPRARRTLPAPAWTYRYHKGVDALAHPWAGGEVALGFARLTGDACFALSTRGLGPVRSPDTGIVLRLDGLTVLDRQLPVPASSLVSAFDARFELAVRAMSRATRPWWARWRIAACCDCIWRSRAKRW